MEKLIPQIIAWAEETNIVHGSNLDKETLKLVHRCGELARFINNQEICTNAIGHCMMQMIIICRMRNTTLDKCLEFTKTIKDERVTDPKIASIMVLKTLGELANHITTNKDIKAQIGYLLIYLTALTNSLQLSMKECTESAFKEVKDIKGIMFDGQFIDETHEKYKSAVAILKSRKSSLP